MTAIENSPHKMAVIGLEVSLNRTISAQTFMHRLNKFKGLIPKQQAAIKNCVDQVKDNLDRVRKFEFGTCHGSGFHMPHEQC